jgi:hypothetical protein
VNGGGLRAVLESVKRRKLSAMSQRIICVAMGAGNANDGFIIPTKHAIQKTHRAGVRDQGANLGFIDEWIHSLPNLNCWTVL